MSNTISKHQSIVEDNQFITHPHKMNTIHPFYISIQIFYHLIWGILFLIFCSFFDFHCITKMMVCFAYLISSKVYPNPVGHISYFYQTKYTSNNSNWCLVPLSVQQLVHLVHSMTNQGAFVYSVVPI